MVDFPQDGHDLQLAHIVRAVVDMEVMEAGFLTLCPIPQPETYLYGSIRGQP